MGGFRQNDHGSTAPARLECQSPNPILGTSVGPFLDGLREVAVDAAGASAVFGIGVMDHAVDNREAMLAHADNEPACR